MMGELHLIIGCMWSGKSTELLRRVRRHIQHKSIIIKYDDGVGCKTHDKIEYEATFSHLLSDVNVQPFKVIGIDEGQFFKDLLPFCIKALRLGKILIVAGLDGDFLQRPFGDVLNLIPICDSVVKLNAVCVICYKEASFSKRTCNGRDLIIPGEGYIPVCRICKDM